MVKSYRLNAIQRELANWTSFLCCTYHDLIANCFLCYFSAGLKWLCADDQLCQRQSWALSPIIAIELPGNGWVFYEVYEPYTSFYDQYVRNGFGLYRNLRKGMNFNAMNSEWLTFIKKTTCHFCTISIMGSIAIRMKGVPENSCSFLQLGYSSSIWTAYRYLYEDGNAIDTYTIVDIMSYPCA